MADVPGALRTEVWKRNRSGKFLGRYYGPDGFFHVFVLGEGGFSSVDFPGAAETASGWYSWSGGFNDAGDIASIYCSFQPCDFFNFGFQSGKVHGFLATSDGFTSVDFPGADTTGVWGLNSRDEVVGVYLDAAGEHGFLRTP